MEIDDAVRAGWPPTESTLRALLDEACVDAYDEYEQATGIHCVIDEWGGLPSPALIAGQHARVIDVDLREASVVAIVRLAGARVPVPLEDVVPEPGTPAAFVVAMYRMWRGLQPVVEASARTVADAGGWASVAARVEAASEAELITLVRALYSVSDENRRIVHDSLEHALEAP